MLTLSEPQAIALAKHRLHILVQKSNSKSPFIKSTKNLNIHQGPGIFLERCMGLPKPFPKRDFYDAVELKSFNIKGKVSYLSLFNQVPTVYMSKMPLILRKFGRKTYNETRQEERIKFDTVARFGRISKYGFSLTQCKDKILLTHNDTKYELFSWPQELVIDTAKEKLENIALVSYEKGDVKSNTIRYPSAEVYEGFSTDKFISALKAGKIVIEMRIHCKELGGKMRDHGVHFRLARRDTLGELYEKSHTIQ